MSKVVPIRQKLLVYGEWCPTEYVATIIAEVELKTKVYVILRLRFMVMMLVMEWDKGLLSYLFLIDQLPRTEENLELGY